MIKLPTQNTNVATPIVIGTLRVDGIANLVYMNDHHIELSPYEYRVLAHLSRNAGRIVTSDELLQSVWGCAKTNNKRQLRNCIWRLRDKIEPDSSKPIYIVTARGQGYYMPTEVPELPLSNHIKNED